jgi:oligoribonuclease NrnB/cAMP/cGMP phosphodiesterase (DHH superfamily)
MESWKPDLCIYHGNCDDGFGAAWAIWRRWGNEVAYVPGVYGKPLPDATGKHVLFVDFSTKRPEMDAMARVAKSIVVIDHHKTAEAELAPFFIKTETGATDLNGAVELIPGMLRDLAELNRPPVIAYFDMNQSGAVMTWEFAHGITRNDPPPTFLALIQDRDLWRFDYGDKTKRFSAALRTYPMTFEEWDGLAYEVGRLAREGEGILRAHNANIEKFLADRYLDVIDDMTVPVVNVPYHYASDTAHALLQKCPEAPFAACWFRRGDGMIQYSLRSEDSRVDVSEVAKKFGGGGHRNAAGYQVAA